MQGRPLAPIRKSGIREFWERVVNFLTFIENQHVTTHKQCHIFYNIDLSYNQSFDIDVDVGPLFKARHVRATPIGLAGGLLEGIEMDKSMSIQMVEHCIQHADCLP